MKKSNILNDESKFKVVNFYIVKLVPMLENKKTRFLKSLKSQNIIRDEKFEELQPTGSKPGILHGLPKVHKQGYVVRPILSAIGTHVYKL